MAKLGRGQAIIGGLVDLGGLANRVISQAIYHMTISNGNCLISLLNRELSFPYENFVAIPITDTISGCITESKYLKKCLS